MALTLNSNTAAPKFTLNTSKLAQGLSVNLSKTNPNLKRAAVKISWKGNDLDISAVGKGSDGKALLVPVPVKYKGREEVVPRDLIFYENLSQPGIQHGGDVQSAGEEETEQMNTCMADLHKDINSVDFIVTSHTEKGPALLFKDVKDLRADMIDLDTNEILYSTDLKAETVQYQSGVAFAEIKLENGDWTYGTKMVGLGKEAHGVQNILNHYYA